MKYLDTGTNVEVEATQWHVDGDHKAVYPMRLQDRWCHFCGASLEQHGLLDQFEGNHMVCPGDWIVENINLGPVLVRQHVFAQRYREPNEVKPVRERKPRKCRS